MKNIKLKKDMPGLTAGAEAKLDEVKNQWVFWVDANNGFSFTEEEIRKMTDWFSFEEEEEELKIGDVVIMTTLIGKNGRSWQGEVGKIGIIEKWGGDAYGEKWVYLKPHFEGSTHPVSLIKKLNTSKLEVVVGGYTAMVAKDGVHFGCNFHPIENIKAYLHLLTSNKAMKIIYDIHQITIPDLLKIIAVHNDIKDK